MMDQEARRYMLLRAVIIGALAGGVIVVCAVCSQTATGQAAAFSEVPRDSEVWATSLLAVSPKPITVGSAGDTEAEYASTGRRSEPEVTGPLDDSPGSATAGAKDTPCLSPTGIEGQPPDCSQPNGQFNGTQKRSEVHWRATIEQSLFFTSVMHAFRIATEPSTRADLAGRFFPEYFAS